MDKRQKSRPVEISLKPQARPLPQSVLKGHRLLKRSASKCGCWSRLRDEDSALQLRSNIPTRFLSGPSLTNTRSPGSSSRAPAGLQIETMSALVEPPGKQPARVILHFETSVIDLNQRLAKDRLLAEALESQTSLQLYFTTPSRQLSIQSAAPVIAERW